MAPRAFKMLSNAMVRGALSEKVTVIMGDDMRVVGAIDVRRNQLIDGENHVYITMAHSVSLRISDLLRMPVKGDQVIVDGRTFDVEAEINETGAGMVEFKVSKALED